MSPQTSWLERKSELLNIELTNIEGKGETASMPLEDPFNVSSDQEIRFATTIEVMA